MKELNERIRDIRLQKGYTLAEVAKKLGVQEATVQRYESGTIKNIKHETIVKLANIFECSPASLMGWGEMSKERQKYYTDFRPISTQRLPMLGRIAAGTPITAIEEHEFVIAADCPVKADYALEVVGDSMIGAEIYNGDIVFIRRQPDVNNGEIAAVLIDDETTLKRVYKKNNQLILIAENPDYPPIILTAQDGKTIQILGKAVGLSRMFKEKE